MTNECFKNAKKIKLPDLNESQISKQMFKYLNLNLNILPQYSDIHNFNTGNKNNLTAPKYNIEKLRIFYKFPKN